MTNTLRQNEDGTWGEAAPLGWQEEHTGLAQKILGLLGISHCGKRGWRK